MQVIKPRKKNKGKDNNKVNKTGQRQQQEGQGQEQEQQGKEQQQEQQEQGQQQLEQNRKKGVHVIFTNVDIFDSNIFSTNPNSDVTNNRAL